MKNTQYKKVSSLKADDYRQVGQYVSFSHKEGLSRLLVKHGRLHVHLHGKSINQRFNKCYKAKKDHVILPEEPQQVRMLIGEIPINKLKALKGICEYELSHR